MPAAATLKPVYALVGSDSFLQLEKLIAVLARAPKGTQRTDIDGERAELSDVLDELRSYSMFGTGKLVVVTSAEAFLTRFREQLEHYVAEPSDSATLVLRLSSLPANQRIYKAIAKVGQIEDCNPPKDIPRWIIEHAKSAHKLTVQPDAARLLADYLGDSLGRIDTELAKLAITVDSGKVAPQDVAKGVAFQREMEMSELTNAVAKGNSAEAVKRWRQLVQSDSSAEFRAVMWLGIWLTNVRKALAMKKKGMAPFAITSALRIWPKEIQGPFMETASALGEAGMVRAIDLLAEVDKQSKSGVGDATENVERFILSLSLK